MSLFWLSDPQWEALASRLPRAGRGPKRVDDRRVISGILHVLRSGCRWRDCPPQYGPYTTIYNRFHRWSAKGIWQQLFAAITKAAEPPKSVLLDSTSVKAHRSAGGGKGGIWFRRLAARVAVGRRRFMP